MLNEDMDGSQNKDKFKKCCEAFAWSEVVRDTLHSLIAAMERERPPPQISADAPKLVNNNCVKRTFAIR